MREGGVVADNRQAFSGTFAKSKELSTYHTSLHFYNLISPSIYHHCPEVSNCKISTELWVSHMSILEIIQSTCPAANRHISPGHHRFPPSNFFRRNVTYVHRIGKCRTITRRSSIARPGIYVTTKLREFKHRQYLSLRREFS